MQSFFQLSYYLTPRPNSDFQFTKLTFAIGLALIISGLVFYLWRKKYCKDVVAKKIFKPYPGKLFKYGILLLLLLLIREMGIPYLSMRLWWLVLLLFFIYTWSKLIFTYKTQYRERSSKLHIHQKQDKYLPKKKK